MMMTEYKDNETYEGNRRLIIELLEKHAKKKTLPPAEIGLFKETVDLLRQSKWVGDDSDHFKPCTLLKDVNTTTKSI